MTQAQIAGGSVSPQGQVPTRGFLLRDFALPAVGVGEVRLSDFRARANLVVVFAGPAATASNSLREIAECNFQLQQEDAQVVAVVQGVSDAIEVLTKALELPFPVLVDEDGHVHRDFGAADAENKPFPAVYITDRYGEVFGSYRSANEPFPAAREILEWLSFINSQCPECESPEWPIQ